MKKRFLFCLLTFVLLLLPPSLSAQVNEYFSIYSSWGSTTVTLKTVGTPNVSLEYSTDKNTWNPVVVGTAINVSTKTYFRGSNPTGFSKGKNDYAYFKMYSSSTNITLAGNIMSLVSGAGFANNCSTIPNDYCFYRLFYQENTGTQSSCHQFDASNLSFPAEYLTTGCYMSMFELTNIYYLPQLPSQHLADSCYFKMFYRCQSIQTMAAGSEYVLPAEELAPHCYEYMLSRYTEGTNYTNRYEIMATSLKDRRGNDIARCLGSLFQYQTAGNKNNYWYVTIYFKEWGSSTAATCPTYGWFSGGYNTRYNYFNHDAELPQTKLTSSPGSSTVTSNFPYSASLTKIYPNYLTFDCKTNGGTWESDSEYNTDLRRVVKANYTAKTIPAPPVKANARFLGWFTSASGDGSLLTEDQLKQITTATTVYARFVDNDKYTFFVNPSDKATITVTDNSSNSYTPGTLYILDSNDKTFTLSCTGVTAGWSFYRWLGGLVNGNTVQFAAGQLDLVVSAVITGAPNFSAADVTVYQVGTGEGRSNAFPLPAEAVDLGDAGIWAKYNVDKTTANGFAASNNVTGSHFAWGMTDLGTGYAGASSMTDGDNLPVTDETDAAYKYCGSKWRIATKDEWQTLLDNTTPTGPTLSDYSQTFTSNSTGNSIKLKNNGYYSSSGVGPYFETVIMYWTSTFESVQSSGTRAYAYSGSYCNSVTYTPIINAVQEPSTCTSHNYIQYGYAIRPILNVNKRTLTVHADGHTYYFDCDLYQTVNITAVENEEDGYLFSHWTDEAGNTVSNDNPMTVVMYDDQEFTAVFVEGEAEEHHVTFYDEDGVSVLDEFDLKEGRKPTYHGETPTKEGYVFNGWSPAITRLGDSDAFYTATYVQVFTVTVSAAHGTVTVTPGDLSDEVSENVYKTGTSLIISVTPDAGWTFTQWTGGNSNNPRVVTVTANASYTAEFSIESSPASVDAYQAATTDVKKIVYNLSAKTGDDGLTYTPVDMGTGVAWADRNVGATSTSNVGSYFRWGDSDDSHATLGEQYQTWNSICTVGNDFPSQYDIVTAKLGDNWRMPSKSDFEALLENVTITNNNTFTSKSDGSKSIIIPNNGNYAGTTKYDAPYQYYWSKTYYGYQNRPIAYGLVRTGENTYKVDGWDYNNGYTIGTQWGLGVRAIYEPQYTVRTLTIHVGGHDYIYYCQDGQQVTVTVHPNTAMGYLFKEWTDNHSDDAVRTFTVTADATYTATFKDNPAATTHTVSFVDYNGSSLQSFSLIEGRIPVYSGATPSRDGYRFTGWTGGNDVFTSKEDALPALTSDVVYTATYVAKEVYFTITNTHESASTTVKMRESSNNMSNRSYYVRIINSAGVVTSDWTTKSVTSTTQVTFGTIPAGSKMQIYGNGGNTATSTSYYDYFVISGGTPELSGNIT